MTIYDWLDLDSKIDLHSRIMYGHSKYDFVIYLH